MCLPTLLSDLKDMFTRYDLDLREVTVLEHSIGTSASKLVKQRLRRTPLGFAEEEEAHIYKMLRAEVIQPSVSELAEIAGAHS